MQEYFLKQKTMEMGVPLKYSSGNPN